MAQTFPKMGATGIKDKKLADAMDKLPDTIRKLWPDEKEHRPMIEALESSGRAGRVAPAMFVLYLTEEEVKARLPRMLLEDAAPQSAMPPPSYDRDKPSKDTVMTKKRKKGDQ
ncbi:unnamed protein product [Vitrella brassicaformis CCMP3155]|uniref:Uncharacterized protein n=2 Tax=Vitrella brassicaformis TaxID=1169539 RepID=A0A0G4EQX6_VITBC|nr:unnamed protein product [Vitrella brassicaformis CCMP3155]|eukprot:CEL99660.1 unnamed protein product [Vitrella brassicaformis CCMP3155]